MADRVPFGRLFLVVKEGTSFLSNLNGAAPTIYRVFGAAAAAFVGYTGVHLWQTPAEPSHSASATGTVTNITNITNNVLEPHPTDPRAGSRKVSAMLSSVQSEETKPLRLAVSRTPHRPIQRDDRHNRIADASFQTIPSDPPLIPRKPAKMEFMDVPQN